MSNILTNNINPRSGNTITIGGVNDIVSIAGSISYDDVTNVDAIGIVTARGGLNVGPLTGIAFTVTSGGAVSAVGIATFTNRLDVGSVSGISKLYVSGTGNGATGSADVLSSMASASTILTRPDTGSAVGLALGARTGGGQYIQGLYGSSDVTAVRDISINPEGGNIAIGTYAAASTTAGQNIITFGTNLVERMRIDSSGRVLIGTDATIFDNNFGIGNLQVTDATGFNNVLFSAHSNPAVNGCGFTLARSRGTQASPDYLQSGDLISRIVASCYNGGNYQAAAAIQFDAAADQSSGDLPGRMQFYTVPDGSATLTERMRILADGSVLMGGQTSSYDGQFVNLELRTDSNTTGGSMTLVNNTASQAGATCEVDCFQNFRAGGKIVFGRENGNNWQSSAAGAASFLSFWTNNAGTSAEKVRITAAGRLLIGATSTSNNGLLMVKGNPADSTGQGELSITRGSGVTGAGQNLGYLNFGEGGANTAVIKGITEANWTSGSDRPTYMTFETTPASSGSPTERMRITSSGFVGINETAPGAQLTVKRANTSTTALNGILKLKQGSATNGNNASILFSSLDDFDVAAVTGIIETHSGTEASNEGRLELWTKHAGSSLKVCGRFDSEGSFYNFSDNHGIYTQTSVGAGTLKYLYRGSNSSGASIVFNVWSDGTTENTTGTIGTVSDESLKENIVDAGSQWADIKAVKFRKFNFKEETGYGTHTQLGVIAQELEATSPGLIYEVTESDGKVIKRVKSSILTNKALVALQEAMARIETLEQRLTDAGL